MYNGTRMLAENIANGIHSADPEITIRLFNSGINDKTDINTEIFRSKAVLIGSPVVNSGVMHSIAGLLDFMKGLKFQGKKAASFGCYGWHDAATKIIEDSLKESGFEILMESLGCNWAPDQKVLESAVEYGRQFATKLKES